jgi:hypothetical protein
LAFEKFFQAERRYQKRKKIATKKRKRQQFRELAGVLSFKGTRAPVREVSC